MILKSIINYPASDPCWSPDGKHIVYSNHRAYEVFVVDVDGHNNRRIGFGESPKWIRDSKFVVCRSGHRIRLINVNTTENTTIYENPEANIDEISISNDGETIAFIESDSKNHATRLMLIDKIGHSTRLLAETSMQRTIHDISWSPNDLWIVCELEGDVCSFNIETREERTLFQEARWPIWSPIDDTIACVLKKDEYSSSRISFLNFRTR